MRLSSSKIHELRMLVAVICGRLAHSRLVSGTRPSSYANRASELHFNVGGCRGTKMNRRLFGMLFASVAWLLASGLHILDAQDGVSILSLAGRWAGTGTMIPASGPSETFRCVVTYFPSENGSRLRQNLRCKSASYQFDGATQPKITAGKVTGRWQDKINSLDGTISGTVTPDGFHILLSGQFFDAKMTVVSSPCQQSVTIVPEEGTPIKKLSAVLKKC